MADLDETMRAAIRRSEQRAVAVGKYAWACEPCGWDWPDPDNPPADDVECPSCGGWLYLIEQGS